MLALVPQVTCALRTLVRDMPHAIRVFVLDVLYVPYVPCTLHPIVPHVLHTLRNVVPDVSYKLLYLTFLVPCVFSCLVLHVLFCS